MPEERMVKKVYKWKAILTRPLGRPKNRWEDGIRNDMKKLKIKNWTSYPGTSRIALSGNYLFRRPKRSKIEVVAPEEEELGLRQSRHVRKHYIYCTQLFQIRKLISVR
jgi:hypothetical protein